MSEEYCEVPEFFERMDERLERITDALQAQGIAYRVASSVPARRYPQSSLHSLWIQKARVQDAARVIYSLLYYQEDGDLGVEHCPACGEPIEGRPRCPSCRLSVAVDLRLGDDLLFHWLIERLWDD